MKFLTASHNPSPRTVTVDGQVYPTQLLIDREDWALLAQGGVYRHITPEGPAPLNPPYTDWVLTGDTYTREIEGTEAEHLDALKVQKKAQLYGRRVAAEKSNFQHTDGRWYDGSDDSIERFGVVAQQITWALMAGTPTETPAIPGGWRDVDDVAGPSTIAEIQALLMSHYGHGVLCEQNSQALKTSIDAATTIAELDAIDLAAGWPVQA